MKSTVLILISFFCLSASGQSLQLPKAVKQPKVKLFELSDVRLLDGQFKHIQDLDLKYLLSLDPDRLLAWYRRESGLTPKAKVYPFWESEDVWGKGPLAGHTLGFYLSSMSMMYEGTKDPAILKKLDYTLSELEACQKAGKDGYLLAVIDGRKVFQHVADGNFTTSNPLINDSWEPVYIMNKVMLGLYDTYVYCHRPKAREIFLALADWFGTRIIDILSHEQMQKLLVCEHGSINESYVNAYMITGNAKYFNWSKRLNDEAMLTPLSEGHDILNGWHANTQIPKFTGFENVYNYSGDDKYTVAARNFWDIVTRKHTWANGANSTGEHFFSIDQFKERLNLKGGAESCNSVNMLRLTEILYSDYAEQDKIDYYEQVLYNHILANYDPIKGMCVYFTSMRPGHYKVYGTEFGSFWCCTGTGMEGPAKFGKMIYAHTKDELLVNMFIPSSVNWLSKGLLLTQKTAFPDKDESTLTIKLKKRADFTLKIRKPYWADGKMFIVTINGKPIVQQAGDSSYVAIRRTWKSGDVVSVKFPAKLSCKYLPGDNSYLALFYGPIMLGQKIKDSTLTMADFYKERQTVAEKLVPLSVSDSLVGKLPDMLLALQRSKSDSLSFDVPASVTMAAPIKLIPYNRIHFSRYQFYFKHYQDISSLRKAEAESKAK